MKDKQDEVCIKRIKSSNDKYVDQVIDLYKYNFPDVGGTNYSEPEVREMMNTKFPGKRISDAENITLAAILKEQVIGFVFCHFYPESRKAIVSYIAVKNTRHKTSNKLVRKLNKILVKSKKCDELFFETEGSDFNKGLVRWFSKRSGSEHLKLRMYDLQYQCPKVSMSHEARESSLFLFGVGVNNEIPKSIDKSKMLEILSFIYFDCYGDLYDVKDPLFIEYKSHLNEMYKYYEENLPDEIPTSDGTAKLKTLTVSDILKMGENSFVEFKSSWRWNFYEEKMDKGLDEVIFKAICGFHNGKGGRLFIGVSDKGKPLGLEKDLKGMKIINSDQFQNSLRMKLNEEFGKVFVTSQLKIEFPVVDGNEICEIYIKKGKEPLYCEITNKHGVKSPCFFVRSGNTTIQYTTPETVDYIRKRFKGIS